MKYLSVCSGIEAASVAWHPLGWTPVAFSEIEKFPSAVLRHHYPNVPNWGDMTKFKEWPDATINVLVGGTPCQSFSVAGLRKGLDDPRGNLALTYLAILDRYRPEWCVWENVPGVLSSGGGRDFGAFLGGLGQLGYGFAYRVLDAQFFGLAQRRKRVFVVANLRGWQRAAAVLFDSASLRGDSAPRREAGQGVAGTIGNRPQRGDLDNHGAYVPEIAGCLNSVSGHAVPGNSIPDVDQGYLLPVSPPQISLCLNAGGMGRLDAESETLIPIGGFFDEAIPIQNATRGKDQNGLGVGGDVMFTLDQTSQHAIAWSEELTATTEIAGTVQYGGQGGRHDGVMTPAMRVRRLTPVECERLQGFPDDYTLISWRGKADSECPDVPRYKALGNSMARPVMEWIGRRIQVVTDVPIAVC